VQLGGPSTYQGIICAKPYIGDANKTTQPLLISKALRISLLTSFLMVLVGAALKCIR